MTTYLDTLRQVMDWGELMPCPFCGGKAYITNHVKWRNNVEVHSYLAGCNKCGITVERAFKHVAIHKWNTRHYLPLIRELVRQNERYREALKLFMVATDKIERTDLLYDTRIKAREALQETLDKEVL